MADLVVGRNGDIFASSLHGLWKSVDDGLHWSLFPNPDPRIDTPIFVSDALYNFYLLGDGIWRYSGAGSTGLNPIAGQGQLIISNSFSNKEITLSFLDENAGSCYVTIHDILGKLILTRDLGLLTEGPQNIKLAVESILYGAYFISVVTPTRRLIAKTILF